MVLAELGENRGFLGFGYIEEVKKALMSPLALYHEGEIYTYDEFAETHVEADIPAETLDDYFDFLKKSASRKES